MSKIVRGFGLTLINTVVAVLISFAIFGWEKTVEAMGGLASFGAVIGLLICILIVLFGLLYLAQHDYTGHNGRLARDLAIGVAVVIVLGVVGFNWVSLPNEAGWKLLIAFGLIAIQTAVVLLMLRRKTVPATS